MLAIPLTRGDAERHASGNANFVRPSALSHPTQRGCSTYDAAAYCRTPQWGHSNIGMG
jgi:hypothetical protein